MRDNDPYPFSQRVEIADPLGLSAPLTGGLIRDSFHDEMSGDTRLVDLRDGGGD